MSSVNKTSESTVTPFGMLAPAMEYAIDAAQRTVLFWDVMRQRGNQYANTWRRLLRMCSTTKLSWSSTDVRSIVR